MHGKPLRLVAVNKYDLLHRFHAGGAQKQQAMTAIEQAGRHGFVAMRFAGVGFYPRQMNHWANEKAYWGGFDELVAIAKRNGVGLIPVIHWNTYLFPDMAGECVQDMLLNEDSRSRQYLWLYTYQLVTRYKDEPTVLFWELTNEMNLGADLAFQHPYGRSQLNPVHEGTSYMRLRRDHYTTDQMIPFIKAWATFIRSIDTSHLISAGFSAPRPAAQHLRLVQGKGDWTHDSPQEMETYLRDTHPDPIELISIHFYAGRDNLRFGNTDRQSVAALKVFKDASDRIGKPLYLGETGFVKPRQPGTPFLSSVLSEVVRLQIPLTLVWDWYSHSPEWAVSPEHTPEVVRLMEQANQRFAAAGGRR